MEEPRGHGLRNGLLLAGALVLVAVVVGVVALVIVLHRVGDAVSTAARDVGPDNPGAPDQLTVAEGSAFTFHDQRFEADWKLAPTGNGKAVAPEGLKLISEDDSSRAPVAYVDVRLYHLAALVAVSHCQTDDPLAPGSPNTMTCSEVVPSATPVNRIEVADFRLSP